ncbi:MAG: hypothetical protein AB7P99_06375 [Vicinamibacterales bacterium]
MLRIIIKLIEMTRSKAYGQITIAFQAGKIQMVHVHQTFKVDEIPIADVGLLRQMEHSMSQFAEAPGKQP